MKRNAMLWPLFYLANLVVIELLWYAGSFGGAGSLAHHGMPAFLIAMGRLTGLLAEYFILLELVLIGRIRFIERQYGFDKMNFVHRYVGYFLATFLLLHPILLTGGYAAQSHVGLVAQFFTFLSTWEDIVKAFLGFLLFMAVIVLSISIARKRLRYETWYLTHLFVYAGIALSFGHQINTADVSQGGALYYWLVLNFAVFGLVILYRFLRPWYLFFRHRFKVDKVIEEAPGVYSVYIVGRKLDHYHFKAGQYAHVTFLARGMWYSHPFSFSVAPNGHFIRFTIKKSGDFTARVGEIRAGTRVMLDGPFGTFTAGKSVTGKYLLIAGGIGVTPIRSLAEFLIHKRRDVRVLYSARSEEQLVFKKEFTKIGAPTEYILSQAGSRLDLKAIKAIVPDWRERDIYICGPKQMTETLVSVMRLPKEQVHYELFGY
jgi:predicted ferric reductase